MRKAQFIPAVIASTLILSYLGVSPVHANAGSKCSKIGSTKQSQNVLVCKKIGKKLVWVQPTGQVPGSMFLPPYVNYYGSLGLALIWASPSSGGSSFISGYRIEFMTSSVPWQFLLTASPVQNLQYIKDERLAGTSLRFRVAAINDYGVGSFTESNWVVYGSTVSTNVSSTTVPAATATTTTTTVYIPPSTTTTTVAPTTTTTVYVTNSRSQAVKTATSYLRFMSFSRSGLIKQLEYEKFSLEDATYGVDAQNADWNAQAVKTGASYLRSSFFSRSGLISQLESEGFSSSQASGGVDAQNADWNSQAAKKATSYLKSSSFSRSGLISQLVYEGFTQSQAEFGVNAVGL